MAEMKKFIKSVARLKFKEHLHIKLKGKDTRDMPLNY
jgi:hypothetical protein